MTSTQAVAIRKQLGINKAGFARLLGVGTASVARWEADESPSVLVGSTAEVLAAFERALGAGGETALRARKLAKDAEDGRSGLGIMVEKVLRGE